MGIGVIGKPIYKTVVTKEVFTSHFTHNARPAFPNSSNDKIRVVVYMQKIVLKPCTDIGSKTVKAVRISRTDCERNQT